MTKSLTVVVKVFSNTSIFCCRNVSSFCDVKATAIFFFSKNINIFAIFQERIFNVTLAINFVKF